MEFVEARLIAKRELLDELVKKNQEEMQLISSVPLNEQADFLYKLVHQAVNEVVKVEFGKGLVRTVLIFMKDGHCYPFDIDWQLPQEAFVDRLMNQVIVTYAEDIYVYDLGGNGHDESL
jgi:hypothetical protein